MSTTRAAILLSCIALAAPGITLRAQSPSPAPLSPQAAHDLLHQLDDAFAALFDKVAPAVVVIEADKKPIGDDQDQSFDYYFHTPEGGEGNHQQSKSPAFRSEGSGFIVKPDGYIYTNFHVIEDTEKIEVRLRDNRRFIARVVGVDETTDIAVLKIDAAGLPTVPLADSDTIRTGQMCFAIGIPYNLDYSFCRGIISGMGRGNLTSSTTKPMYEDYIQTDAFINPGNSGGPLLDIDGRVIGMNTLINGLGRGLSFAIPSNMLNNIGAAIIADGKVTHPWIGVVAEGLPEELEDEPAAAEHFHGIDQGVCVKTIEANAPAFKSDLRPMDLITKVDGVPIFSAHDLQREVLHKKVGDSLDLNVWRSGKTMDIAVVTDVLPTDLTQVIQDHPKAKIHPSDATSYGIEFAPAHSTVPAGQSSQSGQTQPVRDKLGDGGATIASVSDDSPASRADLRPGDVITGVDEKPVADPAVCIQFLTAHRGASGPTIYYIRDGKKSKATLDTAGTDNP